MSFFKDSLQQIMKTKICSVYDVFCFITLFCLIVGRGGIPPPPPHPVYEILLISPLMHFIHIIIFSSIQQQPAQMFLSKPCEIFQDTRERLLLFIPSFFYLISSLLIMSLLSYVFNFSHCTIDLIGSYFVGPK